MSTPQEQLLELIDVEDLEGFKKFMNLNILWRDIKFFEEKYSILHIAACQNRTKLIKYILEQDREDKLLESVSTTRETVLHSASENGAVETLQILIEGKKHKNLINIRDNIDKMTPLLRAVSCSQVKVCMLLLEAGADPNICDSKNNSPLATAIGKSLTVVIDALFERDVKLEEENNDGIKPIHIACKRSDPTTLQRLLERRVNYKVHTNNAETPISISIKESGYDCVHLLLNYGLRIEPAHIKLAKERGSGGLWHELLLLYKKQEEGDSESLEKSLTKSEIDMVEVEKEFNEDLIEATNLNSVLIKFNKIREFGKLLLHQRENLMKKIKDLESYNTDLKEQNDKNVEYFEKEFRVMKTKNTDLMKELNFLRKKKHTILEEHKIADGTTIGLNKNLIINASEIKVIGVIGEGSSGIVYKALYKETEVALKKLIINTERPQQALKEMLNEMRVLEIIRHPNIVLLLGFVVEKPNSLCIVTELMNMKSLKEVLIRQDIELSLSQKIDIGIQICQAMISLHSHSPQILHRDLKSANCLVDHFLNVKICDFGIAKVSESKIKIDKTKTIGTYQWVSPETLSNGIFTHKSDVYSFGMLLWELFTRKIPFHKLQPIQVIYGVIHENRRPLVPPNCPKAYANLIQQCWDREPQNRLEFTQIIELLRNIKKNIEQ